MENWLQKSMRGASALRFFGGTALLGVYALWLLMGPSPFARSRSAAIDAIPELIAGFPAGEPAAALDRMGPARMDYLWSQAFDLILVALILIVAVSAIALALRRLGMRRGDARYLLLLPAIYAVFELAENGLLALFASGAAAPTPALVILQQSATTMKLAALLLTAATSLIAAIIWAIAAVASLRRSAP